jgi:hypothetical protein
VNVSALTIISVYASRVGTGRSIVLSPSSPSSFLAAENDEPGLVGHDDWTDSERVSPPGA